MYVYVLDGEHGVYVGQTCDLKRRLQEHREKRCRTSARIGDFSVAHWWNVPDRATAERFENLLHCMQFIQKDVVGVVQLANDCPVWCAYLANIVAAHKLNKYATKLSWQAGLRRVRGRK